MTALSWQFILAMAATVVVFWALPQRWPGLRWLFVAASGFICSAVCALVVIVQAEAVPSTIRQLW